MTEPSERQRARDSSWLLNLIDRLKNQAAVLRNGGGEKRAGELLDEAGAISRLLAETADARNRINRLLAENAALRIERDTGVDLPRPIAKFLGDMGA